MSFLTTSKRYYVVGVHSSPLSLILHPLPRGFEWFLCVKKSNFPESPGNLPSGNQMASALS